MVCVAITRGGHGDVWLFATRTEAYLHPLVQYGDALISHPDDLVLQYPTHEWGDLRRLAGLVSAPLDWRGNPAVIRRQKDEQALAVMRALETAARSPPSDPQEICNIVARDRRLGTVAKKKTDAPAPPAEAKAVKEKKAVGTKVAETKAEGQSSAPLAVRGPKGVAVDAVIRMGSNTQGVAYGPDNNPKKPGSKTHSRFALYTDGMTIQQAIDVGIPTADLVYDQAHGFIKYSSEAGGAPKTGVPEDDEDIEENGGEEDGGEEDGEEEGGEEEGGEDGGEELAAHPQSHHG